MDPTKDGAAASSGEAQKPKRSRTRKKSKTVVALLNESKPIDLDRPPQVAKKPRTPKKMAEHGPSASENAQKTTPIKILKNPLNTVASRLMENSASCVPQRPVASHVFVNNFAKSQPSVVVKVRQTSVQAQNVPPPQVAVITTKKPLLPNPDLSVQPVVASVTRRPLLPKPETQNPPLTSVNAQPRPRTLSRRKSANNQQFQHNDKESDTRQHPRNENEREAVNYDELPLLEADYVFHLKKKSLRFTKAIYFCRLCDHHINTLVHAKTHISSLEHKNAKYEKSLTNILRAIPKPTSSHCEALSRVLTVEAEKCARTDADYAVCDQIVRYLNAYIQQNVHPECYLRMYGSCATRFALRTSNLNLELMYPDAVMNHAVALMKTYEAIAADKLIFPIVKKDFCHKWPYVSIEMRVGDSNTKPVLCVLSVRNAQAFDIGRLLGTYTQAFPSLQTIGQIWRIWAKRCEIDNFQTGGLPSYAFDLMLVHYLQQIGLLPVLHELYLSAEEKKNGDYQTDLGKIRRSVPEIGWSFGEIFIGLLRYYTVGSDAQVSVINVRSKSDVSRESKGWNKKRFAIEDPFMPNKNLSALTPDMFAYIVRCFQNSYKYFGIPQTAVGPLFCYENNKLILTSNKGKWTSATVAAENNAKASATNESEPQKGDVDNGCEKHVAGYQVIFNENVRNVPEELRRLSPKSSLLEHVENAAVEKTFSEEEQKRDKRSVRNFCAKKLNDLNVAAEGEQLEDQQVPLNGCCRYERCSMLEIAKFCNHAKFWPDLSLLSEYRQILDLPLSTKTRRTQIVEKLGSTQVAKILTVADKCVYPLISPCSCMDYDETKISGENGDDVVCSSVGEECTTSARCEERKDVCGKMINGKSMDIEKLSSTEEPITPEINNLKYWRQESSASSDGQLFGIVDVRRISKSSDGGDVDELGEDDEYGNSAVGDLLLDEMNKITEELDNYTLKDKKRRSTSSTSSSDEVEFDDRVDVDASPEDGEKKKIEPEVVVDPALIAAAGVLTSDDFAYNFDKSAINNVKSLAKPAVKCDSCRRMDHMTQFCPYPEKEMPRLIPLNPISRKYIILQSAFVEDVWKYNRLSERRKLFQETFRQDLEQRFCSLWPEAKLWLFGSSCNGFGFTHSDLDVCLTFNGFSSLPEGVDQVATIKKMAKFLQRQPDFGDILPVTKAKVPIVKFFHRSSKLEGDISLYNILPLRNTHLLYQYSQIDQRAQILGYMAKVFAKNCDIGDASRGSLSSYAYVILVIHYLQQCKPPVLPILQEIHADPSRPQIYIVEGWDTYFYPDFQTLSTVWKGYGYNRQSVGELWLGFLRYYTETFNPRNDVVQIRRSTRLTKFEKSWTDRPLAIEDPFDLNHNLASGLSKKMFMYIWSAFQKARHVFGDVSFENYIFSKFRQCDLNYERIAEYIFGVALKMDEPPPKDRACKFCERVGHFVENCPMKRSNSRKLLKELMEDDDVDKEENKNDVGASRGNVINKRLN